ncbi:hypothetical protein Cpir12675_004701 [Ceratocystis pirilliformis]|uniref:Uncharacterized protein n=1 Tax=Ceratocystis pirilliformis TaxID=259994 RepID=A0ABR3YW39_9PEZI
MSIQIHGAEPVVTSAIPELESTAESRASDTASSSATLLTEPENPAFEDAHYEQKYRLFAFKMKKYETQQKALQSIAEFIDQTVSGNLRTFVLADKYTVKDQIAALHDRFKLSTAENNKQACEAWKKAFQTPKKQGLETWFNNLLAAHKNLTKLGLSAQSKHCYLLSALSNQLAGSNKWLVAS